MPDTIVNFITHLRPFEFTVPDTITMYDKLPYKWDVNLCNRNNIALESGNIIKSFRCNFTNYYEINHSGN